MIQIKEAVVRQALEALEFIKRWGEPEEGVTKRNEAITALRQALEQPAQQDWKDRLIAQHEETIIWQAKRIADLTAQQEPVAYIRKDQLQKAVQSPMLCEVTPEPRQDRVGIYTRPQAREPLTDAVRNAFLQGIRYSANKYETVWEDCFTGGDVSNFLLMEAEELDDTDIDRAIEAAHGIGEKK